MRNLFVLGIAIALVPSCKSTECGEGTTERDGNCVPASEAFDNAKCGSGTELHGDQCEPALPPTMCDPATTREEVDENGVITCVGTGAAQGCSARIACPAPTDSGKQTICGQIYDFETGEPFAAPNATGAACAAGATSGPCGLGIRAFDAVQFVQTGGQGGALTTGAIAIDDCGRYRVSDIAQPAGPLIALGFDDADPSKPGPMGFANSTGIATPKTGGATRDVEAFYVSPAKTAAWAGAGVPFDAANGIFAAIYRGHKTGFDTVAGVTVSRNQIADAAHDYYFTNVANRTAIDSAATATSANGGALFNITNQAPTDVYSGSGALPSGCMWDFHAGASVPYVVFVQIFRPTNVSGMTCSL
jgi:hypothetical protein